MKGTGGVIMIKHINQSFSAKLRPLLSKSKIRYKHYFLLTILFFALIAPDGLHVFDQLALVQPAEASDGSLKFKTLKDYIGTEEEVNLNVYFIGFPAALKNDLKKTVRKLLSDTDIVDAKPWWIPNMPRYGEEEFALAEAPVGLPPELIPPDGYIRYDPISMEKMDGYWDPIKEIEDLVDDWHKNVDIVNYIEHEGSLRDVMYEVDKLDFYFLPPTDLKNLYAQLRKSKKTFVSNNPSIEYILYSYNELFNWFEKKKFFKEPRGGAALVFMNLEEFADQTYTFYGEPSEDWESAVGNGPSEVQYPPAVASSAEYQNIANLMTLVLGGGLTQAKMLAALEVRCAITQTAEEAGLVDTIPGIKPEQSVCAQWTLEPIRNLLGNKGRRLFASDSTEHIANYSAGALSKSELLQQVEEDFFELYRFGVLQTSIKPNIIYSEAYELRTLIFDLRFDQMDLCILTKLQGSPPSEDPVSECETEYVSFPTERTYDVTDVFDVELAKKSLSQFNPGRWEVTFVPFPFGLQPDGTIDPVKAAQMKAYLREFLNEPTIGGVTLKHPPLYRTLTLLNEEGDFVDITSSWEKGLDVFITTTLLSLDEPEGLGIYNSIWPDAQLSDARPFHETGKAAVKPLILILTPPPDGPLGEKWGTFPFSFQQLHALGAVFAWGGGGFWLSVGGNEQASGLIRRDFLTILPQYVLGKERASGSLELYGVMPDGTVQSFSFPAITLRPLELGAPHWCNEFNSEDAVKRTACRDFVRTTTTLQAIETLQHGLGYMHAPEPRKRYHFDGEKASIERLYELAADPTDQIGLLLHQLVNQYTTLGVSTVWGQITSEWNGVGPQAGMQATLHRSHAREEITAGENHLAYAIEKFKDEFAFNQEIKSLLVDTLAMHDLALSNYDDWDYEAALESAMHVLSFTDQALTLMGEPDHIHDPVTEAVELPTISVIGEAVDINQLKSMLETMKLEDYTAGAAIMNSNHLHLYEK